MNDFAVFSSHDGAIAEVNWIAQSKDGDHCADDSNNARYSHVKYAIFRDIWRLSLWVLVKRKSQQRDET